MYRPRVAATGYEVLAVRYAWRTAPKSELYFRWGAYHEPDAEIGLDYYFWVLREGERTVLVDTGASEAAMERRGFRPAGATEGVRFVQCSPVDAFAQLGIDGESVDDVIITHLHWDHIGNL